MYTKGQKVVCVNDVFGNGLEKLYKEFPVMGVTYTIREVFLGISAEAEEGTVGVTLVEIVNPDNFSKSGRNKGELGFNGDRFAPLETDDEEDFATSSIEETAFAP